ncbi:hypothetical protein KC799_20800, partial [candidate division KSB1 bacterium]|nr:hypothetical protein [candidate division KSB1 bacterium]
MKNNVFFSFFIIFTYVLSITGCTPKSLLQQSIEGDTIGVAKAVKNKKLTNPELSIALFVVVREMVFEVPHPNREYRVPASDVPREQYLAIVRSLLAAGADPTLFKYSGFINSRITTETYGSTTIVTKMEGRRGEIMPATDGSFGILEIGMIDLVRKEYEGDVLDLLLMYRFGQENDSLEYHSKNNVKEMLKKKALCKIEW